MRLTYDDSVDADDRLHSSAVEGGIVPPGCLLGGPEIWRRHDMSQDPCASCDRDREQCGGRSATMEVVRFHRSDDADARRLVRARARLKITRLLEE